MRPLHEMPAGVRAAISGVVFDVDDTITRDGRVERAAGEALWRLADAGVRAVAVTGRPLGWADVLVRLLPVEAVVAENGAGWVSIDRSAGHGVVREGYFHPADERARHAERLERIRARVADALPEVGLADDQRARRCDLAFDVGERVTLAPEVIARLVDVIEAEGARSVVSSVHAHAMPGAWDKAIGTVRALGDVLGIDLEGADERARWVFVGDSGNDADAFAWFPVTVGVANVVDHLDRLPTPPRWVTPSDRGRGFAELVDALLAAPRSG